MQRLFTSVHHFDAIAVSMQAVVSMSLIGYYIGHMIRAKMAQDCWSQLFVARWQLRNWWIYIDYVRFCTMQIDSSKDKQPKKRKTRTWAEAAKIVSDRDDANGSITTVWSDLRFLIASDMSISWTFLHKCCWCYFYFTYQ